MHVHVEVLCRCAFEYAALRASCFDKLGIWEGGDEVVRAIDAFGGVRWY